jgi:chitin-binding protein
MDDLNQISNSVKVIEPYPVTFSDVSRTEVSLNFPWSHGGIWIRFEGNTYTFSSPTTGYKFTGLAPGQLCTFTVEERNRPPWNYSPNTVSVTTLKNRPTKPGYLGSFEHTVNSVLLHWGPGTVDGGPVLYRVRRDEVVLEETEDTAYRDLTPEQGRTYVYSVCTLDNLYQESERTTLTLRFDDLTPPTEISNLRTTHLNLQVLWDPAYDSSGRVKYHVYLNGDHKGTTDETAFSITEMESGKRYQICVEAEDASGNKSEQVCTSYPPLGISLKHKQ